jgi:flagellar biosynthesis anti-sigma factor FlgM
MKVQGAGRPPIGQVQEKSPVKSTSTSPAEKSSGERVAVSSLSKALAQVRAPNSPDVEKVEKLRESIRTGEFKIDHEQVAQTMVNEET